MMSWRGRTQATPMAGRKRGGGAGSGSADWLGTGTLDGSASANGASSEQARESSEQDSEREEERSLAAVRHEETEETARSGSDGCAR